MTVKTKPLQPKSTTSNINPNVLAAVTHSEKKPLVEKIEVIKGELKFSFNNSKATKFRKRKLTKLRELTFDSFVSIAALTHQLRKAKTGTEKSRNFTERSTDCKTEKYAQV